MNLPKVTTMLKPSVAIDPATAANTANGATHMT